MYFLPQEIETWYIIPALRREIARELIEHHDLSYEEAGGLLGISKAAVSQYLNGKRAAKIRLPSQIFPALKSSCVKIVKKKSNSATEIQKLLGLMHTKKLRCEVCKSVKDGTLDGCKELQFSQGNYELFKHKK